MRIGEEKGEIQERINQSVSVPDLPLICISLRKKECFFKNHESFPNKIMYSLLMDAFIKMKFCKIVVEI